MNKIKKPFFNKIKKPFFIENKGISHTGKYFLIISKHNNIWWGHNLNNKEDKKLIIKDPTGNYGFYKEEMIKITNRRKIKKLKNKFNKIREEILIEAL